MSILSSSVHLMVLPPFLGTSPPHSHAIEPNLSESVFSLKNGEWWYHSINNVENLFSNELQTIPLILNLYIWWKKSHYTSTFGQSCCLSLRFHSPPPALLSLATCLKRAKTFNPGLKFSETDLQSEHLLFHVLTHLVSKAWWFCWRWSEKNTSPLVLFVSSSSLPVRQLLCNFHFIQLQLHDHVPTIPQLQFPPESRDLGDLLLQGGGHPLLPALVPVQLWSSPGPQWSLDQPDHLVHVLLDRADQLVVRVVGAVHNVLEALQVVVP